MKFMEALDKLQDKNCIGIFRDSEPNRIVTWHKTNFKHFYTNEILLISKQELFAADWELFKPHGE